MPHPVSPWLRVRWPVDRVIAALLSVPVSVVVGVLAALVRLGDGGPGLVRLRRVGEGGSEFLMWKLRTMRAGRDGALADGSPIAGGQDRRITGLGRVLRHSRLDELPQLYNVVTGQMALLGPRPETPEYVDADDPRWACVLSARPAIAGPTQVVANRWEPAMLGDDPDRPYREVVLPVKLAIDQWYVRNASPWVDILVVASLAQQFVLRRPETFVHARLAREGVLTADVVAR